jgi:hypothetical protein
MATPQQLLAESVDAVFEGNANKFRVASDPSTWNVAKHVLQANASDGKTITLIRNRTSSALGIAGEPTYTTLIQSPILYAGRADVSDNAAEPEFFSAEFRSRYMGVYWEARYGLDKGMKTATPFLNNGDPNVPSAYSIDLFPLAGVIDNWRSTQPESLLISASSKDEYNRRYAFSGNKEPLQSQTTGVVSITDLDTHPTDSQLRQIRQISSTALGTNEMLAISVTTEQRRRLTIDSRLGSNPGEPENTEGFGLYNIADDLSPTYIGEFNGTNWSSADIKVAQLLAINTDGTKNLLLMPPNSHGQFVQHAADTSQLHIGTLAEFNGATAEVTTLYPIYFVPGTDGYDSIRFVSMCHEPTSGNYYALVRTKTFNGTDYIIGFAVYKFDLLDPVTLTFICQLNSVTYSDNQQRLTSFNLRGICAKLGTSASIYAVGNYSIGDVYKPESYLFEITLATGAVNELNYIDNREIESISVGSNDSPLGEMYGMDGNAMQLVEIAHHGNMSTLTRSKGVLTIDVLDQAAQNHEVWTTLNIANERAANTYDLLVISLEGTRDGELVEIEFGSSISVNDQRTPIPAQPHRFPDNQRYRVTLKANEPVDVFINISSTEFGNFAFRQLRHLALRIVDASQPFTVRLLRAQMCKVNQTQIRPLLPSSETMEKYAVFAPFSATDRRVLAWFVQYRAVLISKAPPLSPRLTGWIEQQIEPATVINHPFGRLRGGKTFTPYQNDAALNGNTGFAQSPVSLPAAYLQDGFGVDPSIDAAAAPVEQQIVTVEFDIPSSTADNTSPSTSNVNYIITTSDGLAVAVTCSLEINASLVGLVNGIDVTMSIPELVTISAGTPDGSVGTITQELLGTNVGGTINLYMENEVGCVIGAQDTHDIVVTNTPA